MSPSVRPDGRPSCEAGVPQGRLRWLAAICFTLLKLLDGIPRNSTCNGTPFLLRSHTRDQQKNNKRAGKRPAWSCHAAQLAGLHCRFSACFPVPVRLLCGRLPHRAPLFLPAHPALTEQPALIQHSLALLSLHQHAHPAWWGSSLSPLGRTAESRSLLPSRRQRTSTRQNNKFISELLIETNARRGRHRPCCGSQPHAHPSVLVHCLYTLLPSLPNDHSE